MADIFNTTSKTITIMTCSACNENCNHCYISYQGNKKVDELKNMIVNLQKQGWQVVLNGSEPLLFDGFLELYSITNQDKIFSNGRILLQKPELINDIIKSGLKKICLSYHYGVQNQWSKVGLVEVEKVAKMCKVKGVNVCLMCSLCQENYLLIDEICAKAKQLNIDEVHFTNFICQGNAVKNGLQKHILSEEQILFALKKINELRNKYDINDLKITRCGSFGNNIGSKNYFCDAGITDFVITPDNNIYPCIFFAGVEKYKLGEYVEGELKLNKKCNHNCSGCFAKDILNYNQEMPSLIQDI
ncbi:MAG: radical SAM protein [Clostridiales bacterium]|nr:radical SAM protein [Clostridiales bacterium]